MQIILKQGGQPVVDFSISGANVTVAGIAVDCAERQQDIAVTVEVRQNIGGPSEGGDGVYLAQIEIPARRYETVTTPADDEGEWPIELREPLPLDPNAVIVTLWPAA